MYLYYNVCLCAYRANERNDSSDARGVGGSYQMTATVVSRIKYNTSILYYIRAVNISLRPCVYYTGPRGRFRENGAPRMIDRRQRCRVSPQYIVYIMLSRARRYIICARARPSRL